MITFSPLLINSFLQYSMIIGRGYFLLSICQFLVLLSGGKGRRETTGLSGNLGFSKDNLSSWSKLGFLSVFSTVHLSWYDCPFFLFLLSLLFPFCFPNWEREKGKKRKRLSQQLNTCFTIATCYVFDMRDEILRSIIRWSPVNLT